MNRFAVALVILLLSVGGLVADSGDSVGGQFPVVQESQTVKVVGKLTQYASGWYLRIDQTTEMKLLIEKKDKEQAYKLTGDQVRLTVHVPTGPQIYVIVERIEEVKP